MSHSIALAKYDHEVYHSIVPAALHIAQKRFEEVNAQAAVNTVIRDCFLRHGVEHTFSACVNHRHFDCQPDERNIELNGEAKASRDFANIHPCTWLFNNKRLYPYEYKRLPASEKLPAPPQDFVTELGLLLEKQGLSDIIGLQVYTDGVVGVESTNHDTNTSTTVDCAEKDVGEYMNQPSLVRASFAFFNPKETV